MALELRVLVLRRLGQGSFGLSVEWLPPVPAPYHGSGEFRATLTSGESRYFYRAFPELKR